MKKIFLFIFLSGCSFCYSQEEMETDRPDQTECTSLIQPGAIQIETGVLYSNDHFKNEAVDIKSTSMNYATTLIRIGVFKAAEFRLEIGEYEKTNLISDGINSSIEGFSPVVIGTKMAVCEEKGIIPKIAFLGHLQLPLGDKKFISKNEILPSFRFSLSHTLTPKLSLGYNLGMEWGSSSLIPDYVYTLTIGAAITNKMEVFIETYGNFASSALPESYFDCGMSYNLLSNLKIDASGGFALNKNSADMFLSAGISVRLPH